LNKNTNQHQSASNVGSEVLEASGADNEAKWGFLKNIVNIDRFFASGAGEGKEEEKKDAKLAQTEVKKEEKIESIENKETPKDTPKEQKVDPKVAADKKE